jgi:chromosome segregation ATPase
MGQFGKQLEDSKRRLAETTEATEHDEKSIEAREKELAEVNKQIAMKKKRIAQETAEQQKLKQSSDAIRKTLTNCV